MSIVAAIALLMPVMLAQTSGFEGLGQLPGYGQGTFVTDVSGDGRTVIGYARGVVYEPALGTIEATEAWLRTSPTALIGLGRQSGSYGSRAVAISRDGSCIVGTDILTFAASGWEIRNGVRTPLTSPVGPFEPVDLNSDGSVIIGTGLWALEHGAWVQPGVGVGISLPACSPGLVGYRMIDVADNGIIAMSCPSGLLLMDGSFLVPPPTGVIRKVTSDASVVLGYSLWRRGHPPVFMGSHLQEPADVSDDGEWVVGVGTTNAHGSPPFTLGARIWSERTGIRTLECVLREQGVSIPAGWRLLDCIAVSDDGSVIVGNGVNPSGMNEAWRAVLGVVTPTADHNRSNGFISVEDLFSFLDAFFGGSLTADYNYDGTLGVGDIFRFLQVYFGGCD